MSDLNIEDNDNPKDTKKSLITYITSNIIRLSNDPDNRSLLFLIAALSVISNSNDSQYLNIARRLAQLGATKKQKIKEDAPVNNAGSGNISGIGVGDQGEPGINRLKFKKMFKRKIKGI